MKWFFIGGYIGPDRLDYFLRLSLGNVDFSANVTQGKILDALIDIIEQPIEVVSTPFIRTFPGYSRTPIVRSASRREGSRLCVTEIGYLNIEAIKIISRAVALARHFRSMNFSGDEVAIAYSMHTPFLIALRSIKHRCPDVHTCLMVMDMPEYMRDEGKRLSPIRLLKKIDRLIMNHLLKYVDSYVVVTKQMIDALGILGRRVVVVEGFAPVSTQRLVAKESGTSTDGCFRITYTGTLQRRFGIGALLEAFSRIDDPSLRLCICGKGEMAGAIAELSARDSRIEWLGGVLPEKALCLQANSTVLINPRQPEGEYTKYSFPSKLLEYLSSGRPVIAYRLDGIPSDYEPYVYWIEGQGAVGIEIAIRKAMKISAEDLDAFGRKAADYVAEYKTSKIQVQRVVKMIEDAKG